MTKCRFEGVEFGEVVSLSGGSSACQSCGAEVQKSVTEAHRWIYQGHSGGMDLFAATEFIACPSCGKRVDGHVEHCAASGTGLDASFLLSEPALLATAAKGGAG